MAKWNGVQLDIFGEEIPEIAECPHCHKPPVVVRNAAGNIWDVHCPMQYVCVCGGNSDGKMISWWNDTVKDFAKTSICLRPGDMEGFDDD